MLNEASPEPVSQVTVPSAVPSLSSFHSHDACLDDLSQPAVNSQALVPFEVLSSGSAALIPVQDDVSNPHAIVPSVALFPEIPTATKDDGTTKQRLNQHNPKKRNAIEDLRSSATTSQEDTNIHDWHSLVQELQNPTSEDQRRQLLSKMAPMEDIDMAMDVEDDEEDDEEDDDNL